MQGIRVLQINAGSRQFGGVSALLLNLYRHIGDGVTFDFLTPNVTTYGDYREEIEARGGRVLALGIDSSTLRGKLRLYRALRAFLRENRYDILHVNSGVLLFNTVAALACRRYGGAKLVVHSHSNGGRSRLKEALSGPLKAVLSRLGDRTVACSASAAEYMFTRPVAVRTLVLNNGIDADRYRYDPQVRAALRAKLGLSDRYVLGLVGRLAPSKNHAFLLELLRACLEREPDCALLLAGDGELREELEAQAERLGLSDRVVFAGAVQDPWNWYQAMDVFVLPARFEGFGIVNVEAQAAGLSCVVSDAVPAQADATGSMTRLSLAAPMDAWVDAVLAARDLPREDRSRAVRDAGFDIRSSARQLRSLYEALLAGEGDEA